MREVWQFVRSVFSHWVSAMTGVAGLVLSIIAGTGLMGNDSQPKLLFWGAAILCVFVAMYRAWLSEHRSRVDEHMTRLASENVLAERMAPRIPCERCGIEVPIWFIDLKMALPPKTFTEKTNELMTGPERLNFSEAQIQASLQKPAEYETFGCCVCSGRIRGKAYPGPGESRGEFAARLAKAPQPSIP